ncbi:MAG: hypothetical protein R3F07_14205 [Opitutaceae bacterium]
MTHHTLKNICIFAALMAVPSLPAAKKPDVRIPIADNANIVVEYVELLRTTDMGGLYPAGAETDRRTSIGRIFEEAFADGGYKVNIETVPNNSGKTGDLTITIMMSSWELNRMGEYECRFSGTIANGDQKIDLGMFVGTYTTIVVSSSQSTKAYDTAARKAVDKLLKHFFRA